MLVPARGVELTAEAVVEFAVALAGCAAELGTLPTSGVPAAFDAAGARASCGAAVFDAAGARASCGAAVFDTAGAPASGALAALDAAGALASGVAAALEGAGRLIVSGVSLALAVSATAFDRRAAPASSLPSAPLLVAGTIGPAVVG